jgi:hypothetical protein
LKGMLFKTHRSRSRQSAFRRTISTPFSCRSWISATCPMR